MGSPIEVWKIVNNKDKSQSTNSFIKHIKENLNLISAQFKCICKLVKLDKENVPKDWIQKGQKRALTAEEICNPVFKWLKENVGLSASDQLEIKNIINDNKAKV